MISFLFENLFLNSFRINKQVVQFRCMDPEDLEIPYVSNYSKVRTVFDKVCFPFPNFTKKGVLQFESGYEIEGSLPDSGRIVLYSHGWGCTDDRFQEQLNFIKDSLENQEVETGVVGWRWRSDLSWGTANKVAEHTGREIVDFIEEVRKENPEAEFVLIGYSLGAKVVFEALKSMEKPQKALNQVFLLAGAVGSRELAESGDYWNLIQEPGIDFYNYHNTKDKVLKFLFPLQGAIGREGILHPKPDNLHEIEIKYEASSLIGKKLHKSYMSEESVFKTIASEID